MKTYKYDFTDDKWISGEADFVTSPAKHRPKFSIIEWLIFAPIMVGLGFMIGVYWP